MPQPIVKTRQQFPKVVTFSPAEIKKAVSEVEGFNAKFAVLITRGVGTMACAYLFALPFFQNTVAGDLVYAALLFGGFALLEDAIPSLREAGKPQPA